MRHSILNLVSLVFFTVVNSEPCKLVQPACPNVEGTEYELTLLPFITDCSKYIICQRGTPIVRPCPGNLIFNVELKVCDFPYRTKCIQCDEDEQPDISTPSTTTAATSTTVATTNATRITSDTTIGANTDTSTIGTNTDATPSTTIGTDTYSTDLASKDFTSETYETKPIETDTSYSPLEP